MSRRTLALNHLTNLMTEAFVAGDMSSAIEYEHTLTAIEEMTDAAFAALYTQEEVTS